MGWTKHHDAIEAHRKARSTALNRVAELLKLVSRATVEELSALVLELHSELQFAEKMHHAVGSVHLLSYAQQETLDQAYEALLDLVVDWSFELE